MRAILVNPRYTGRQVWNRQRTDHDLIDPDNTSLGHRDVMRWNTPEDWAISRGQAHPALVGEADFVAVQHVRVARETAPGRTYLPAGMLRCGVCGRRMDAHWAHQRPGYWCRHGHTSANPRTGGPGSAYVREDRILAHLPALVLRLTAAAGDVTGEAPTTVAAIEHLRASGITLAYDPAARTLTADTERGERILITHWSTRMTS